MTKVAALPFGAWPITPGFPTAKEQTAYEDSLGAIPRRDYDPDGFLQSIGVDGARGADGRDDRGMLSAWRLTQFKPEETYLPEKGRAILHGVQTLLLSVSRLSPLVGAAVAQAINHFVVKDTMHGALPPFGEPLDGVAETGVAPSERYVNARKAAFQASTQHAFDANFHEGSISRKGDGGYGTYDIALGLGFSAEQATRLARTDFDVDEDETPLQGSGGKPRLTGGANGQDLQFHYNRAPRGQEDTRLQVAELRLQDAIRLARAQKYHAAEQALGLGLHSLQDLFAHGQIVPITHVMLGSFPDQLPWTPVSAYEAERATEGYLRRYLDALGVDAPPAPSVTVPATLPGTAPTMTLKDACARAALPADVAARLPQSLIFYQTSAVLPPSALGFGLDENGDGRIGPEEALRSDGRSWNDVPAGCDTARNVGFIDAAALASADGPTMLRHELLHALVAALPKSAVLATLTAARDAGRTGLGPADAQEYLTERLTALANDALSAAITTLAQGKPLARSR